MYFGLRFVPLDQKNCVEFLESRSQNSSRRERDREKRNAQNLDFRDRDRDRPLLPNYDIVNQLIRNICLTQPIVQQRPRSVSHVYSQVKANASLVKNLHFTFTFCLCINLKKSAADKVDFICSKRLRMGKTNQFI